MALLNSTNQRLIREELSRRVTRGTPPCSPFFGGIALVPELQTERTTARLVTRADRWDQTAPYQLWQGKVESFLAALERRDSPPIFDLVVTSPPYNIGKDYEERGPLDEYLEWQEDIIKRVHKFVKPTGSICWQVGNYVENGSILPLDIEIAPVFKGLKMKLRNRIIWRYGHGLHCQRRFSGRYEVVLWYTKSDEYTFNLDPVRIPSKYPGKKHFQGPKKGEYSGNPKGKNPEDVWDIPNVKSNHVEKTDHPCQFPVGLIERLALSLTHDDDLIFDPFAGVASAGVAAVVTGRRFWGCEVDEDYSAAGLKRIDAALSGKARYRPHDREIMNPELSPLSRKPEGR